LGFDRMRILVMKFGGTSVADPEKIQRAAERAIAARRRGQNIVVVVSAPGEMTDELLALAQRVAPEPDNRELDQLIATGEQVGISLFAIACKARRAAAISLTGPQAGIETEGQHTHAHIVRIRPRKILRELDAGRIVTVAGFQGVNPDGNVATLGRGGSDLTAVALASALKTGSCEIFTDVKGVYTADPRIVSEARKLTSISFAEMLELAASGTQVMQTRSLELAQRFGVAVHVRSAFHSQKGTWIVKKEKIMLEKAQISALAIDKSELILNILDVPDRPGAAARLLSALAARNIPVGMIVQSVTARPGQNHISIMIPRTHAAKAQEALKAPVRSFKARLELVDQVAKVSAVGTGFRHHPRVAVRMFEALSQHRINIRLIQASDLRISCVIDSRHGETALRALHRAYELGKVAPRTEHL
jgi:aspartate kinase